MIRNPIRSFLANRAIRRIKVTPFVLPAAPRTTVPDYLKNTPKRVAKKQAAAQGLRRPHLGRIVNGVAETTMAGTDASIRSANRPAGGESLRSLLGEMWQQKMATINAKAMDELAGRSRPSSEYDLFVTAHTPNDFLGFAEGWQNRVGGKVSADAIARFDRLRNSLDHYAPEFASNKVARDLFRANYAEMRAIYLKVSNERYVFSPHDGEIY